MLLRLRHHLRNALATGAGGLVVALGVGADAVAGAAGEAVLAVPAVSAVFAAVLVSVACAAHVKTGIAASANAAIANPARALEYFFISLRSGFHGLHNSSRNW